MCTHVRVYLYTFTYACKLTLSMSIRLFTQRAWIHMHIRKRYKQILTATTTWHSYTTYIYTWTEVSKRNTRSRKPKDFKTYTNFQQSIQNQGVRALICNYAHLMYMTWIRLNPLIPSRSVHISFSLVVYTNVHSSNICMYLVLSSCRIFFFCGRFWMERCVCAQVSSCVTVVTHSACPSSLTRRALPHSLGVPFLTHSACPSSLTRRAVFHHSDQNFQGGLGHTIRLPGGQVFRQKLKPAELRWLLYMLRCRHFYVWHICVYTYTWESQSFLNWGGTCACSAYTSMCDVCPL
jgi:hypothetical protein